MGRIIIDRISDRSIYLKTGINAENIPSIVLLAVVTRSKMLIKLHTSFIYFPFECSMFCITSGRSKKINERLCSAMPSFIITENFSN